MLTFKRDQEGFTLLESMLVLVISASMMMMGIRLYQSVKRDGNLRQIQYNVDAYFQAAARYYQANCRSQIQITPGVGSLYTTTFKSGATLDTQSPGSAPIANPFSLTNALLAEYLSETIPAVGTIVNGTIANGGYVVQLNQGVDGTRTLKNSPAVVGYVKTYTIQVSVRILNPTTARMTQFKNMLAADCWSIQSGSTVLPCTAARPAPPASAYLVWERMPISASADTQSQLWPTTPTLMQFQQMYVTPPVNATAGKYLTGTPITQTFLCGS